MKGGKYNMLLNIEELSDELKVHYNTIFKWIKKGMPCFKKGRVIRFNLEKVLEWLEKSEKQD